MNKFFEKYETHFLVYDPALSCIISFLLILFFINVWSLDAINSCIINKKTEVYPLIASIAGTLLGFIITGISIIIAFSTSSKKLELFRSTRHYKTVLYVYLNTIIWLGITTVVSTTGLIFDDNYFPLFMLIFTLVLISTAHLFRCIWILKKIIDIIDSERKNSEIDN